MCVCVSVSCHCYCCSWLHVCVLRFVEVARIGLPPAIYLVYPSPSLSSRSLCPSGSFTIFARCFFHLCCAIFVHTIAVFLHFLLFLSLSRLSLVLICITYFLYTLTKFIHSRSAAFVFCFPARIWHCDLPLTGYSLDKHSVWPVFTHLLCA